MKLNRLEFALMNNRVRAWSQRALETPLMIGGRGALRGQRVLEVGCGRGVGIKILLEQLDASEVVAFDYDSRMVALARERAARFGDRACVFVGDAEHIGLPDASFDVVVEFGILHHVPDWRSALGEIARVLKPGGVFYFEDVLRGFVSAPVIRDLLDHPQAGRFTGSGLRGEMAKAGLQLDDHWRQFAELGLIGRAERGELNPLDEQDGGFTLPLRVYSWYGVNGVVRAAGGMDCDIEVEGHAFPHPSLVNQFIRRGLPGDVRVLLGARHEVGHLQTLPLAGLFFLTLLAAILYNPRDGVRKTIGLLVGVQAAWELASESYVVGHIGTRAYSRVYAKPSLTLVLFWIGGSIAAIAGMLAAVRPSRVSASANEHTPRAT